MSRPTPRAAEPTRRLAELFAKRPGRIAWAERCSIASAFASPLAMSDPAELAAALSAHARAAGSAAVAAAALIHGGLCGEREQAALEWALGAISEPADLMALEAAACSLGPETPMLPGLASSRDGLLRGWGALQTACGAAAAAAIQSKGLGLARARDGEWPKLLRFADWSAPMAHEDPRKLRSLLSRLLSCGGLDASMRCVGRDSLHQTIMRRAQDSELAMEALRASARAGFPKGAAYEGLHPLWAMAKLDAAGRARREGSGAAALYAEAMALGFGPSMELPCSMRLSLSATQAKNSAPTLPLEWAKRSSAGCAAICRESMLNGADIEARNSSGETVLSLLNRAAGKAHSGPGAEKEFLEVVRLGADPLAIAPEKDSAPLAANEQARQALLAARERKALEAGLDEEVVARARELMAQALAERAMGAAARRRRI